MIAAATTTHIAAKTRRSGAAGNFAIAPERIALGGIRRATPPATIATNTQYPATSKRRAHAENRSDGEVSIRATSIAAGGRIGRM